MSEHDQQVLVFDWAKLNEHTLPPLQTLFAIPNGARTKTIRHAAALKREGLKKGVPDFMLAHPVPGYSGLFIEMKRPGNKPSPEQKKWLALLISVGYHATLCFSGERAIKTILTYLSRRYKIEAKENKGGVVPIFITGYKERDEQDST